MSKVKKSYVMKKIDFNFEIEGGEGNDGNPYKTQANKGLANFLETQQGVTDEVKIVKHSGWAIKLRKDGFLMLDEGDILDLKKFIKDHKSAYIFFKYPIINALNQLQAAPPDDDDGGDPPP